MPRYEFRCRSCGATFEVNRPISQARDPASCPQGHADTVKLLSAVALAGRSTDAQRAGGQAPAGGGCCGGSCGCGH